VKVHSYLYEFYQFIFRCLVYIDSVSVFASSCSLFFLCRFYSVIGIVGVRVRVVVVGKVVKVRL